MDSDFEVGGACVGKEIFMTPYCLAWPLVTVDRDHGHKQLLTETMYHLCVCYPLTNPSHFLQAYPVSILFQVTGKSLPLEGFT